MPGQDAHPQGTPLTVKLDLDDDDDFINDSISMPLLDDSFVGNPGVLPLTSSSKRTHGLLTSTVMCSSSKPVHFVFFCG